jgi:hypothetical protein
VRARLTRQTKRSRILATSGVACRTLAGRSGLRQRGSTRQPKVRRSQREAWRQARRVRRRGGPRCGQREARRPKAHRGRQLGAVGLPARRGNGLTPSSSRLGCAMASRLPLFAAISSKSLDSSCLGTPSEASSAFGASGSFAVN